MGSNVVIAIMATGMAVVSSTGGRPIQAQSPRSIWSGVYTEFQARRGEQLYAEHCSRCHGADLMGMPLEPRQRFPDGSDRTLKVVGPVFINRNDLPLCDLVERIRISMPQDRPGSLNRRDTVDVVAYLLFQGGFPFGRTELTTRFDRLQEIRILAHRSISSTVVVDRSCSLPAWK